MKFEKAYKSRQDSRSSSYAFLLCIDNPQPMIAIY